MVDCVDSGQRDPHPPLGARRPAVPALRRLTEPGPAPIRPPGDVTPATVQGWTEAVSPGWPSQRTRRRRWPAPGHPAILAGPIAALCTIELVVRPRWVVWSQDTTAALVEAGVRAAAAWDVAAMHRLSSGGWRTEPTRAWAAAHGLAIDGLPAVGPPDLFSQTEHDDSEEQVRSDGYLRPESADGGWAASGERVG